ncbi:D-aminoacyl-tRNA deacylase [Carboxydothermus hydrogenoformans]|uniref:D-aminoacyl-tRNA deacylase n=1 Tax=Carboxydothermus hydrogenoformans (strain ATCC BAA-161 / DSM 6008 / Z-2901) TaxID=246194 RepID=DTD_CARHZ|nr:D-aminoacyl-tRNA deacylase [Carboxydothermus hydrogenoformans]Q3A9Z9.1 RecName: Full=D-aminoacyl-tRNA deacylase; Short=DTD; AltName: Full=Gly-tRNA(Ala) deacylase [Carboxydothermus hydrogenoformans Z-2901]ABB14023.1 D-tyrosyl-tRNA(Tyr) deacylase [Carboxydothermus hydrogenoformans Z-2901]
MRAVVQRVKRGKVTVDGQVVSEIGPGLVALVGIRQGDGERECRYLAEKLVNLRIFEDGKGKFNYSVKDVGGEILVVSNFTVYGDTRKGRRPSFTEAAPPEVAREVFERFLDILKEQEVSVKSGIFQATMEVEIINDGPVTVIVEI